MMRCNQFFNFTNKLQKFFTNFSPRNPISENKQKFIQVKSMFLLSIFPAKSINKLFLIINSEV